MLVEEPGFSRSPDGTLLPGTRIAEDFEIVRYIDRGGFGIVYEAKDAFGRAKAVKEFQLDLGASASPASSTSPEQGRDITRWALERFEATTRQLAALDHPSIVHVDTIRRYGRTVFVVMEFLGGGTLAERIKRDGPMTLEQARPLVEPILDALAYLHNAGLIHRDIKPANIMFDRRGGPVLIDFGSLKEMQWKDPTKLQASMPATGPTMKQTFVAITENYAAPEQLSRDGKLTPAVDVFAVGAMLYQMLAGRAPPPAAERLADDTGKLYLPLAEHYAGRAGSAERLAAVDKALALPVYQRFSSVAQLRHALGWSKDAGDVTAPVLEPSRPAKLLADPPKRSHWGKAAAAVLLVAAGGAAAVYLPPYWERLSAERQAETERRRLADLTAVQKAREEAEAERARAKAVAEEEVRKKAAADQLAAEQRAKEERERQEAERLKREREEKERLAEAERRRLAEEIERQKLAEAARRKAEAERLLAEQRAKEERERQEQERKRLAEEAEARRKAAIDAAARDTAERARLAVLEEQERQEAERKRQEELAQREAERRRQAEAREAQIRKTIDDAVRDTADRARLAVVEEQARQEAERKRQPLADASGRNSAEEARLSAARDCDRLAASPDDPGKPTFVAGVLFENIDGPAAVRACENAAALWPDNARLASQLGRVYAKTRQFAKMREQYEKSAGLGSSWGMNLMGNAYRVGTDVPPDFVKAREWYERAANLGDAWGMHNLGFMYRRGQGGGRDFALARQWFERAAALGNGAAMNELGVMHNIGEGGPVDFIQARSWYERAVEKNSPWALRNLGVLYRDAQGVPQDFVTARTYLEKSASLGNADAMTQVGRLYHNGSGVPIDHQKAREWYQKAEGAGDKRFAPYYLGLMFESGHGVRRNTQIAYNLYKTAADNGNEDARKALERLK